MQKRRCRFYRVPRLLAIVIALKADCSADGRVILRPTFAKFGGGARKAGSEAARFDDRDVYAERPASLDSDSEKPSTPNFAAAYAARPVGPTRPPIDDIWMTCPDACSRKYGSTAFVIMMTPNRFVSICARKSASDVSSTGHTLP